MSLHRSHVIGRAIAAAGAVALLTALPLAATGHAEPTSETPTSTTAAPTSEAPATSEVPLPTTDASTSATTSAPPTTGTAPGEVTQVLYVAAMAETTGDLIDGVQVNISDGTHVYQADAPASVSVVPGDYYVSVLHMPDGYTVVHEPGPIRITADSGQHAQVILRRTTDNPDPNGRATLVVHTLTTSGVAVPNVPVTATRKAPCNAEQNDIPPDAASFEQFTGVTDHDTAVVTFDVPVGCYVLSMTPPASPKPVPTDAFNVFVTEPGSTVQHIIRFEDPGAPPAPQPRNTEARVPVSSIPSGPVSRP